MKTELEAAYERIVDLEGVLQLLRDTLTGGDPFDVLDECVGLIDEALSEKVLAHD